MVDFVVPRIPGWGKKFGDKHGKIEEDDVQIISPSFKRAMEKSQLRAQPKRQAYDSPQHSTGDATENELADDRDLVSA